MADPREKQEFASCPYDPAHRMLPHRLGNHIIKCRRNFPDSKMVTCEFNSNHVVRQTEIQYHHKTCPDRKAFESNLLAEEIEPKACSRFPIQTGYVPECESWDNINIPSYDPSEHIEQSEVVVREDTLSAAERKKFRLKQRERLNELENKEEKSEPSKKKVGAVKIPSHHVGPQIVDSQMSEIEKRILKGEKTLIIPKRRV